MTARRLRRGGPAVATAAALCLVTVSGGQAATTPPGIAVDDPVLAEVDDYLSRQREDHGWPGLAAALVADGEVVWSEGYGTTGPSGVPVTPRTPFLLASVSKSLTAIAVLRLVDAGEIALDDPVTEHVPELAAADAGVTVADLMTQRTGLDSALGVQVMADDPRAPLDAQLDRLTTRLRNDAGFAYSNANYDLLALVVERASGLGFEEVLQTEVFEPLDMAGATTDPSTATGRGLAEGHYHWVLAGYRPHAPPLPDGAVGSYRMFASAEDLAHSIVMHVAGGRFGGRPVLAPDSLEVLHTGAPVSDGSDARYGGGLWVHPPNSAWMTGASAAYPFLEHDGSALGYRSYIWLMPELGLGLVLLANANDWSDESRLPQVGFNVRQIVLGEEVTAVTTRSEPLRRWGKHLFALLAVAQLGLTLACVRPVRGVWGGLPGGRGRAVVFAAAATVNLVAGYALVRWIPDVADAPLRVVALAPDARLILGVMVTALALAGVLTVAGVLAGRGRRRGSELGRRAA